MSELYAGPRPNCSTIQSVHCIRNCVGVFARNSECELGELGELGQHNEMPCVQLADIRPLSSVAPRIFRGPNLLCLLNKVKGVYGFCSRECLYLMQDISMSLLELETWILRVLSVKIVRIIWTVAKAYKKHLYLLAIGLTLPVYYI